MNDTNMDKLTNNQSDFGPYSDEEMCWHDYDFPLDNYDMWPPNWNDTRLRKWHRHLLFNLSRPEKSLFLKSPLAKESGGFGMGKDGKAVFKSTDDPDYQAIFAMIQDGKDVLEKVKRFDMPGFRPPKSYLREMKRYGVLPASFDLDKDLVDPYEIDRRYWALDWSQLK